MSKEHTLEILGHRGARALAPENTYVSFQAALDANVDMIELDVHLSKDGELVVIHDPCLERTTDGTGQIGDFTLRELQALDASAKFPLNDTFEIQRIPTLQQVYDQVAGQAALNIEIKLDYYGNRYPRIEEKVLHLAHSNANTTKTLLSCFDFPTLRLVNRLNPDIPSYAIISDKYFQEISRPQDVVQDLTNHCFRQVAVNKRFLSNSLLSLLKQAGFTVGVWIVDDVREMWRYVEMGVDRITTDRPDRLVAAYRLG
ncbi:MAG: hypothetical protein JXA42_15055 [Anaerolineales bacterium]|nr:hypothetical protein [Anaerolineales bacterium]